MFKSMSKKIKAIDNFIEVHIVTPIYKPKVRILRDAVGKIVKGENKKPIRQPQETFVKDMFLKTRLLKSGITFTGETITSNHRVAKNRCVIFDKFTNKFFTVLGEVKELEKALSETKPREIGFKKN